MKPIGMAGAVVVGMCALFSCTSTSVKRVDAAVRTDLDGYWNDTDVRIACDALVADCITAPSISAYRQQMGRKPVVIIGKIRNESDEHIDTAIVATRLQNAIIASGVLDFVSSSDERLLLRAERLDQADNASEATAKAIGNETGADCMMLGSVRTIVQTDGNKSVRAYYVSVQLHDLETNRILWSGSDDSIKKVITRRKVTF
ncbi:MAG: penicillin-binding protein activator LpoB [Treponema sp.]|nr:penicillin-binding protein activator LpoB [Treponema sp.]